MSATVLERLFWLGGIVAVVLVFVPFDREHVASLGTMLQPGQLLARLNGHGDEPMVSNGALPVEAGVSILDGRAQIDTDGLARVSAERARLGAQWLARNVRSTGKYNYIYDPVRNKYDNDQYNPVRHAGVTYSLYEAYAAFGDEQIRQAADRGAQFLVEYSPVVEDGRRAYIFAGRSKLGSQALALVALVERRRVTGDLSYDSYIGELAAFMLSMELADQPGRYFQSYIGATGERLLTPDSDYYPGEALLALVRLAQDFPDGPYLAYAQRAAEYLVHVRDGDVPSLGAVPREDHWLTLALSELYQAIPDADYARVVSLQANSMLANQYTLAEQIPWAIGASRTRNPVNYTSTATKAEALVAAWRLAAAVDEPGPAMAYAHGARRTAQFLLRVQYIDENVGSFPDPSRLVGAWGQDAVKPYVRMDFVQHSVSALLGVWRQTTGEKLLSPGEHASRPQVLSAPDEALPGKAVSPSPDDDDDDDD